jgi:5-bromo-4-chloroindolyl phosphate hydrolysis protein
MKFNKRARTWDIVFGALAVIGAFIISNILLALALLNAAGGILLRILNRVLGDELGGQISGWVERILRFVGIQPGGGAMMIFFAVAFGLVWTYIGIKAMIRAERSGRYAKIFSGGDSGAFYPRLKFSQVAKEIGRAPEKVSVDLNVMRKRGYFPNMKFDLEHKEVVLSDIDYSEPLPQIGDEGLTVFKEHKGIPVLAIVAGVITALSFSTVWIAAAIMGAGAFFLCLLFFPVPVYFSEIKRTAPKVKKPASTGNDELDSTLNSIYENKKELVKLFDQIKSQKIKVPGKEILRVLELITAFVTENPDKVKTLRQFVNYYLPTTVSFLATYAELEQKPEKGENINSALVKIEEMTANLVDVFKREYDDLFMDKAMDISAEAAVMKTIIEENKNII